MVTKIHSVRYSFYFPFSTIARINYHQLCKYFPKMYDRITKREKKRKSPSSRWMTITIRVKVATSSRYPRNFKFNVLDSNGIQNDFLVFSLVDTRVLERIEIHVAYVTFSSPVLPAGLFGNTFFMNIPDMFCDLLELPLCRST